ncbi:MAG: hypothetical protein JSU64_06205 [candidate division WOR-3 bacterium]|nr:MAG: hypothetical protein JSU64_06205 [candidate division WOR-3 bacterium]
MISEGVRNWLLSSDDPSVRYYALRDIEGKRAHNTVVQRCRRSIRESKIISRIFEKQKRGGNWEGVDSPYLPKYKASYWQVMILGQLGLDNGDARIQRACDHIFDFQHPEGGFSSDTPATAMREYHWRKRHGKNVPERKAWIARKLHESQLSCLTGNIAAALIRFGYGNDRRLKKALSWLCDVQYRDGGWLCPYWSAHEDDNHGCFYGTISPLEALSEVPRSMRTRVMQKTVDKGTEFMLMHGLFRADHHGHRVINRSWLRFTFPRFSGYDILRGMDVLTKLGIVTDKRMNEAIRLVEGKRTRDGNWSLESAPTGRMHVNIERIGRPSKWITLIALRVLKRLGRDTA